jgi:hypothetical protein
MERGMPKTIRERTKIGRDIQPKEANVRKAQPTLAIPTHQNNVTKLLGKMCLRGTRRCSSRSSPLHQPSSGVAVTAMMSPA